MNIILLSGGSGKRLWPLSNDIRSKQFIRMLSDGQGGYSPIFCRHCDVPDCAASCMSGALQKNMETGLVEYNEEKCAACYMCVMSCRYGVPAITPDRKRVIKCDFCQHLEEGPACVRACPKRAIEVREV